MCARKIVSGRNIPTNVVCRSKIEPLDANMLALQTGLDSDSEDSEETAASSAEVRAIEEVSASVQRVSFLTSACSSSTWPVGC